MPRVRNNHGAMPTWAKILLGLVIVGILGIAAISVFLYSTFKDAMSTDPAKIQIMSKDILTVSDPLPAGFKWALGMNMKVTEVVSAQAADGQVLMIMSLPTAEKDAQAMLDQSTEHQSYGGSTARMVSVDTKGTETVGGQPMAWELGTIEKDGKQSKGFIGVVVDKAKKKTVMIVGAQPKDEYNLAETKTFLKGIQSF